MIVVHCHAAILKLKEKALSLWTTSRLLPQWGGPLPPLHFTSHLKNASVQTSFWIVWKISNYWLGVSWLRRCWLTIITIRTVCGLFTDCSVSSVTEPGRPFAQLKGVEPFQAFTMPFPVLLGKLFDLSLDDLGLHIHHVTYRRSFRYRFQPAESSQCPHSIHGTEQCDQTARYLDYLKRYHYESRWWDNGVIQLRVFVFLEKLEKK